MSEFIAVLAVVMVVVGVSFAAMAIGLIFRGRIMRGGCGSSPADNSEKDISCDACSKKKINLCESDDSTGLAAVSNVATWGRFEKRAPGLEAAHGDGPPTVGE
jgi:hypothetical protein